MACTHTHLAPDDVLVAVLGLHGRVDLDHHVARHACHVFDRRKGDDEVAFSCVGGGFCDALPCGWIGWEARTERHERAGGHPLVQVADADGHDAHARLPVGGCFGSSQSVSPSCTRRYTCAPACIYLYMQRRERTSLAMRKAPFLKDCRWPVLLRVPTFVCRKYAAWGGWVSQSDGLAFDVWVGTPRHAGTCSMSIDMSQKRKKAHPQRR